ncbi:MAG: class I SAM-dependent methyltransferase [Methylotenera sp.]|uniref:class I SAM-dependent methyltransferase n=1 Tax=Methylotenera sp. TaxID=2051956 RepID=UPI0027188249|nr:class I SAM-dependent methyltransferase [Methylotenera sp.]MDO9151815.1 class I SAM-dependent methyltransferase [Methylotenera sp.]
MPLEFSSKYNDQHAIQYFDKHQDGIWRKLSNWRDHQIASAALRAAGNPLEVLDVPCGTGRFWDVLMEHPDRKVYACDYSQSMINTGLMKRDINITKRIKTLNGSAFDLPVPDQSVDNIFCIRFIHHLGQSEDRLKLLREFQRVTRDSVIISMWVDGNIKAATRQALEKRRPQRAYQNRFVIPAKTIEAEFSQAGFEIVEQIDFLKYYHMWRTYVLRKTK